METSFILFDCMETIVDLEKLPNLSDYAAWGFDGSGAEDLWKDFEDYYQYFLLARNDLNDNLPEHREYDMKDRFRHILRLSFPGMDAVKAEEAAEKLHANYWRSYKSFSFIKDDVREVLPMLAKKFRLGVVSNFMVVDGIEELLELHGLIRYFEFVVTSIAEGWRKPHTAIYRKALDMSGTSAEKTVFVGDDYINDYLAPVKLGMKSFYLDRYDRHPEILDRVLNFHQLGDILLGR